MKEEKTPYRSKFNTWIRAIALILLLVFIWQDIVWAYPDLRKPTPTLQIRTLCTDPGLRPRAVGELLQENLEALNPRHIEDIRGYLATPEIGDWIRHVARNYGYDGHKVNTSTFGEIKIHFSCGTHGSSIRYYNPEIHRPYAGFPVQELTRYLHKQVIAEKPKKPAPAFRRFGKISDPALRREGKRYYMVQNGKKRHFHFRWNIFASLDDQIMGSITEREWLIEALEDVEDVKIIFMVAKGIKSNISDENKSKIEAILERILDTIGSRHIKLTDKLRAAGHAKAAKADYEDGELEDIRNAYRNLNRVKESLDKRKKDVESIYKKLRQILKIAWGWAKEINTYMVGVTASREAESLYPLAKRDEIKMPENEPEFEGLEPLIREAIRDAGKRDANLEEVEKKIKEANFLIQFIAEFKDAYFDARYTGKGEPYVESLFQERWLKYLKESGIVRGSPAYWYARFRQAAFIHRTIKNPKKRSERISNPLFEASTTLIQMLKVGNFDLILKTQFLLPESAFPKTRALIKSFKDTKAEAKKSISALSLKDKRDIVRALREDKALSRSGLIELNKCAKFFLFGSIDPERGKRKVKKSALYFQRGQKLIQEILYAFTPVNQYSAELDYVFGSGFYHVIQAYLIGLNAGFDLAIRTNDSDRGLQTLLNMRTILIRLNKFFDAAQNKDKFLTWLRNCLEIGVTTEHYYDLAVKFVRAGYLQDQQLQELIQDFKIIFKRNEKEILPILDHFIQESPAKIKKYIPQSKADTGSNRFPNGLRFYGIRGGRHTFGPNKWFRTFFTFLGFPMVERGEHDVSPESEMPEVIKQAIDKIRASREKFKNSHRKYTNFSKIYDYLSGRPITFRDDEEVHVSESKIELPKSILQGDLEYVVYVLLIAAVKFLKKGWSSTEVVEAADEIVKDIDFKKFSEEDIMAIMGDEKGETKPPVRREKPKIEKLAPKKLKPVINTELIEKLSAYHGKHGGDMEDSWKLFEKPMKDAFGADEPDKQRDLLEELMNAFIILYHAELLGKVHRDKMWKSVAENAAQSLGSALTKYVDSHETEQDNFPKKLIIFKAAERIRTGMLYENIRQVEPQKLFMDDLNKRCGSNRLDKASHRGAGLFSQPPPPADPRKNGKLGPGGNTLILIAAIALPIIGYLTNTPSLYAAALLGMASINMNPEFLIEKKEEVNGLLGDVNALLVKARKSISTAERSRYRLTVSLDTAKKCLDHAREAMKRAVDLINQYKLAIPEDFHRHYDDWETLGKRIKKVENSPKYPLHGVDTTPAQRDESTAAGNHQTRPGDMGAAFARRNEPDKPEMLNSRGETFNEVWERMKIEPIVAGPISLAGHIAFVIDSKEERKFADEFARMGMDELEKECENQKEILKLNLNYRGIAALQTKASYPYLRFLIDLISSSPHEFIHRMMAHVTINVLQDALSMAIRNNTLTRKRESELNSNLIKTRRGRALMREVIKRWAAVKGLPRWIEDGILSTTALEEIEKNTEKIVPLLANALMTRAKRAEQKKEEVVLLLDMPAVQSEKIKCLLNDCIIKPLMRINGNNGDIKRILKTLTVAERNDIETIERRMARKREPLKSENVIIVTDDSHLKDFDKFTNSFITALDFSALRAKEGFNWEKQYFPYVEATFFAVIRALGCDKNDLLGWYNAIPNVKKLSGDELVKLCFDKTGNLKKIIMLEHIPDAPDFDPNDLRKLYEKIEEFIRNA